MPRVEQDTASLLQEFKNVQLRLKKIADKLRDYTLIKECQEEAIDVDDDDTGPFLSPGKGANGNENKLKPKHRENGLLDLGEDINLINEFLIVDPKRNRKIAQLDDQEMEEQRIEIRPENTKEQPVLIESILLDEAQNFHAPEPPLVDEEMLKQLIDKAYRSIRKASLFMTGCNQNNPSNDINDILSEFSHAAKKSNVVQQIPADFPPALFFDAPVPLLPHGPEQSHCFPLMPHGIAFQGHQDLFEEPIPFARDVLPASTQNWVVMNKEPDSRSFHGYKIIGETLYVESNQDFDKLFESLHANNIKKLDVSDKDFAFRFGVWLERHNAVLPIEEFTVSGTKGLGYILQRCPRIKALKIRGDLCLKDAEYIGGYLRSLLHLETLNLGSFKGLQAFRTLMPKIAELTSLKRLRFRSNNIHFKTKQDDFKSIISNPHTFPALVELDAGFDAGHNSFDSIMERWRNLGYATGICSLGMDEEGQPKIVMCRTVAIHPQLFIPFS